jgi:hypothetical protein
MAKMRGVKKATKPPALGGHESNKVALDVLSEDIVNNT